MKNFYRVVTFAFVAVCFTASASVGGFSAAAQTKNSAKSAKAVATPKNQKPPAKTTPKSTPKTTSSSSAAAKKPAAKTSDKSNKPKTADVAKTKDKTKFADKTKSAAKSSIEKNKTATKTTANSKEKTGKEKVGKEKTATAKSSAKSAATAAKSSAKSTKTATKSAPAPKTIAANKRPETIEKSISEVKPTAKATPPSKAANASQIIVAAPSSRVRSEANAGASVVSSADIGVIFPVLEENSIWYRVRLAGGESGWISKQVALDFAEAKREEIYRKILAKNFKSKMDFESAAQTFDFLTKAADEVKSANAQADFNFKRLQALSAALKAIPFGKSDAAPYKDFLKANEKDVVYSEPSGEWYVRSDVFWETHARYKDAPAGEEIAWLAAQTRLPGECEGYVNCYIYLLRVTDGEYLNFYPNGKYARKSVQNIASLLEPIVADLKTKTVYTAATDISDRAEFNRLLTELRQIISKVPFAEKAKAIQEINQIGEGFR